MILKALSTTASNSGSPDYMLSLGSVVYLIFPLAALFSGTYLVLRGVNRLNSTPKVFSGKTKCQGELRSLEGGIKCVYTKIVLEKYRGGYDPWKEIVVAENKIPFYVDDKLIIPDFADFYVTPHHNEGYVKRDLGTIEQFTKYLTRQRTANISTQTNLKEVPLLDENLVLAIRSDKTLNKAISKNIKSFFKLTEYYVPEGATIYLAGGKLNEHNLEGTMEQRILVSDSDEKTPLIVERERAFMGISAGIFLFLVSAALFYVILFSL